MADANNTDWTVLVPHVEEEYGLPPGLIHAIISKESSGKPDAKGRAGERGLMQILPETAHHYGIDNPDELDNPATNLKIGAKHLSSLLKIYDGDLPKALRAWNGGPKAAKTPTPTTTAYATDVVGRWRKAGGGSSEDAGRIIPGTGFSEGEPNPSDRIPLITGGEDREGVTAPRGPVMDIPSAAPTVGDTLEIPSVNDVAKAPAIRAGERVIPGIAGETHDDLIKRTPNLPDTVEHGFIANDGSFQPRQQMRNLINARGGSLGPGQPRAVDLRPAPSMASRLLSAIGPAEAEAQELPFNPKDIARIEPPASASPLPFDPKNIARIDPPAAALDPIARGAKSPPTSAHVGESLLRYGIPMLAQGAAFAYAPETLPAQMAAGAGMSVLSDYWNKLVDKFYGEPSEPMTAKGEGLSALVGGGMGALPAGVESALGIRGARGEVAAAREQAAKEELENQAAIDAAGNTAVVTAQGKQTASRAAAQAAAQRAIESARPDIAERAFQTEAERMTGKTAQQVAAQEAGTFEQAAARRLAAQDPYFKAASRFHEEVGSKFEPYIGKVKNDLVAPEGVEKIRRTLEDIDNKLAERGQRVESVELRKIMSELSPAPVDETVRRNAAEAFKGKGVLQVSPEQYRALMGGGVDESALTYGQAWGQRARANRVLAAAKNPADRWAAQQLVGTLEDVVPNVPDEIRSQYGLERSLNRSVTADVASATNPRLVGDALFGAKDPQAPLNIIRFTKQYAPEQLDGLKEAFADWTIGSRMTSKQFGKINPAIVDELYGAEAGSVRNLLGPEGDAKMRSFEQLVKASPQARAEFAQVWKDEMTKRAVDAGQAALADLEREARTGVKVAQGEKTLGGLGTEAKYQNMRRQLAATTDPNVKLQILEQGLPKPDERIALENLSKMRGGRIEHSMGNRLLFWGMMGMGGYGVMYNHPAVAAAMAVPLALRGGVRYALTTPGGARTFLRMLDSNSVGYVAKRLAGATASVLTNLAKEHADEIYSPAGPVGVAPNAGGSAGVTSP